MSVVASGLISIALAGGCYSPAVDSCQYACAGAQMQCPDGLVCNAQRMCVSQVSQTCNVLDAGTVKDNPEMPTDIGPPTDMMTVPDAGTAPG